MWAPQRSPDRQPSWRSLGQQRAPLSQKRPNVLALRARRSLAQPLNSALSPKAAIDVKKGRGCVPIKLYKNRQARSGPESAGSRSVRCGVGGRSKVPSGPTREPAALSWLLAGGETKTDVVIPEASPPLWVWTCPTSSLGGLDLRGDLCGSPRPPGKSPLCMGTSGLATCFIPGGACASVRRAGCPRKWDSASHKGPEGVTMRPSPRFCHPKTRLF